MSGHTHANRSIYHYLMWVAGILAGIAQLNFLKHQTLLSLDLRIWLFSIISAGIPVSLILKRLALRDNGEPLFELNRRSAHILADYFCAIGSVSLLTLLTFNVMVSSNPIMKAEWTLSLESGLVVVNIVFFCFGFFGLKHFAKKERRQGPAQVGAAHDNGKPDAHTVSENS